MRKVGVNVNTTKDREGKILNEVINAVNWELKDPIIEIFKDSYELDSERADNLELIIVLGGDGTILRTARNMNNNKIPLLGINIGHLGFLTNAEISDLKKVLHEISEGNYFIEDRIMLECRIDEGEESYIALNDIVLSKGTLSRIVDFSIDINNSFYTNITADGIIIATPTGSTAYNISAGGPIIYPTLDVVAITPICPHTLAMRTIVIDSKSKIKVKLSCEKECIFLTVDGQHAIELKGCEEINVTLSNKRCKLIKLNNYNYFDILRNKLVLKK